MKMIMLFWRQKIAFTLVGAVFFGVLGALMAVLPLHLPTLTLSGSPQGRPGLPSLSGASSASDDATATKQPATHTPTAPAASPTNGGQALDLQGTVLNVDTGAGTFVIRQRNGTNVTISVTGTTTFQGMARSLSTLQAGWQVDVRGVFQADGTFAAFGVDTTIDT